MTTSIPPLTESELRSRATLLPKYDRILGTWFTTRTIEQAHELARRGRVRSFLFYRHKAAAIFEDNITATLTCVPGKTRYGFVLRDGWCSQCVAGKTGQRCRHVTAVALLSLRQHEERILPLPLVFQNSPWEKIGRYLAERLQSGKTTGKSVAGKNQINCRFNHSSGLELEVILHPATVEELRLPFMSSKNGTTSSTAGELSSLIEKLSLETATETERALLSRNSAGKQFHIDRSPWMFLCRLCAHHIRPEQLSVTHNEAGEFQIKTVPKSLFRLVLPRRHTWELLDRLDPEIHGLRRLPPAEPFSRVDFSEDGRSIQVESCCRLHDGTTCFLAELEQNRYGSRYCLDNTFFSLASLPSGEKITEQAPRTVSLFSVAAQPGRFNTRFTVPPEELPDFLRRNHQSLRMPRHEVSEAVLKTEVVNTPDGLCLTEYTEDMDWCYLAGFYDMGNQQIDLGELLQAGERKERYIPGRRWFDLTSSPLHWFHSLGEERLMENGRIRLTRQEMMLLGAQVGALETRQKKIEKQSTLSFLLQDDAQEDFPVLSAEQAAHLRDYQVHGVNWLSRLHTHGLGGILADDMGLGKTHQALALIDLVAGPRDMVLLVCPAAVLYHWPQKQEQFFPTLSMYIHHGPDRDLARAKEHRVIVTTYGILRQDIDELMLLDFKLIVYDEMHYLKNRKTALFQAASRLSAGSTIGLSGTPVENSIMEVITLLSLCLPDIFATGPLPKMASRSDTPEERAHIQRIIAPFILRRTREQVLAELPERSEDIRFCELSDDQVAAYRQAVDEASDAVDELLEDGPTREFTTILATITRLKQICNHLCLLEGCTDWERYESGKWKEFTRLLRQCLDSNLKVVVFSQFTSMLDIMECWLEDEETEFIDLRGRVGARERSRRIRRFNEDNACRVCCASLLAGGTGIDLTGAQVVIHYDRWWNPAKEEQATARVHRMGQQHPVQVYRLITLGTLEEKIHRLITDKQALARELIVEDDGSILKQLDRKQLANILRLG